MAPLPASPRAHWPRGLEQQSSQLGLLDVENFLVVRMEITEWIGSTALKSVFSDPIYQV